MAYRQCEGVTKKGLPCHGGAMAGSKYCGHHTEDSQLLPATVVTGSPAELGQQGPFIIYSNRNSQTYYWGPFKTFSEVSSWVAKHNFTVGVIPLNSPAAHESSWFSSR
jgi:hypothetical protein